MGAREDEFIAIHSSSLVFLSIKDVLNRNVLLYTILIAGLNADLKHAFVLRAET